MCLSAAVNIHVTVKQYILLAFCPGNFSPSIQKLPGQKASSIYCYVLAALVEYEDSGTTQKEDVKKTPVKMLPPTK